MQYAHLGRTGLVVSRLCLGTMRYGAEVSKEESMGLMDKALEVGINFFDTANAYGWAPFFQPPRGYPGQSEEVIGKWLTEDASRRDRVVLGTKIYIPMSDEINDRGLSAYNIRRACEDSLRRLGTDRIDVYYMHHIDRGEPQPLTRQLYNWPDYDLYRPPHLKRETQWEEIWQAMEILVQQGKVLYVGSSNFAGWNIVQACERAATRNFLGLVCDQSTYDLTSRMIELEVIPICKEYGLGLVPYSPLGGGLLAGVLQKVGSGGGRRGHESMVGRVQAHRPQLEAYESLCREIGEEPAIVALAWLLKNPVVTAPIIGPRTVDQLVSSLHALEIELDDETLARLDEIWPGPGGEAPDAYAW